MISTNYTYTFQHVFHPHLSYNTTIPHTDIISSHHTHTPHVRPAIISAQHSHTPKLFCTTLTLHILQYHRYGAHLQYTIHLTHIIICIILIIHLGPTHSHTPHINIEHTVLLLFTSTQYSLTHTHLQTHTPSYSNTYWSYCIFLGYSKCILAYWCNATRFHG